MSFRVRADTRNRRVEARLRGVDRLSHEAIREAYYLIGNDLVDEARRLIQEPPKTGRLYRIRGSRHRASARGEAPANLTGLLKRSVGYRIRSNQELLFGAGTEYAPFLENGTQKIQPRPFLIASIRNNERNIQRHIERQIERRLSGGL
jgi:hypothetical protein